MHCQCRRDIKILNLNSYIINVKLEVGSKPELIISSSSFITILYKCTAVFITYFSEKAKLEDNVPTKITIFLEQKIH
jgi:hypothetical protein